MKELVEIEADQRIYLIRYSRRFKDLVRLS